MSDYSLLVIFYVLIPVLLLGYSYVKKTDNEAIKEDLVILRKALYLYFGALTIGVLWNTFNATQLLAIFLLVIAAGVFGYIVKTFYDIYSKISHK